MIKLIHQLPNHKLLTHKLYAIILIVVIALSAQSIACQSDICDTGYAVKNTHIATSAHTNKTNTCPNSNSANTDTACTRATSQPASKHDNTDEIVIGHFLGALNNFSKIVADPEDSKNVGMQVTAMVAHCFSAFIESVRSGQITVNATKQDIENYTEKLVRKMLDDQAVKRAITQHTSIKYAP